MIRELSLPLKMNPRNCERCGLIYRHVGIPVAVPRSQSLLNFRGDCFLSAWFLLTKKATSRTLGHSMKPLALEITRIMKVITN